MVRVVDNRVNSVTRVNNAVDSGFMMAVVEVMVADAHMDGVRVNDGDIVMEEVIQLMMERTGVKGVKVVMVGDWHYGSRRGRGEMARDEEVIMVLDISGGLGGGHSIGGEGDHGVSQGVGGERLLGQQ